MKRYDFTVRMAKGAFQYEAVPVEASDGKYISFEDFTSYVCEQEANITPPPPAQGSPAD